MRISVQNLDVIRHSLSCLYHENIEEEEDDDGTFKNAQHSKQSLNSNNDDSYFNKLKNNFKIRSQSVASVTKRNNKNSLCSREEKHAVINVKLRKFT